MKSTYLPAFIIDNMYRLAQKAPGGAFAKFCVLFLLRGRLLSPQLLLVEFKEAVAHDQVHEAEHGYSSLRLKHRPHCLC